MPFFVVQKMLLFNLYSYAGKFRLSLIPQHYYKIFFLST